MHLERSELKRLLSAEPKLCHGHLLIELNLLDKKFMSIKIPAAGSTVDRPKSIVQAKCRSCNPKIRTRNRAGIPRSLWGPLLKMRLTMRRTFSPGDQAIATLWTSTGIGKKRQAVRSPFQKRENSLRSGHSQSDSLQEGYRTMAQNLCLSTGLIGKVARRVNKRRCASGKMFDSFIRNECFHWKLFSQNISVKTFRFGSLSTNRRMRWETISQKDKRFLFTM